MQGCATYAHVLAGDEISYSDEVEGCYGVRPARSREDVYEPCTPSSTSYCPATAVSSSGGRPGASDTSSPGDNAVAVLNDLLPVLRSRTAALVDLPAGEQLTLDPVQDEPWWAFNYYQGNLASRVVLNTDVPTTGLDLVHLAGHEVYPGHHTEHALKEQRLIVEQGRIEEGIQLVPTPQAVLSEGIAEAGIDVVLDDAGKEEAYAIFRSHGVELDDPALSEQIARASEALRTVGVDAALMIHEDGASVDGRKGLRREVEPRHARPGEAQRQLHHRPDLARLRDHLLGGPRALPRLHRRRPGAPPDAPHGARAHRRPARRARLGSGDGCRDREALRALHRRRDRRACLDGELRELREPATGEVLARAAMAGEADVDRAVAAARAALDGAWGKTPGTERSRLLHALADAIAANRKELAELESRNVGKAISSVKAEIAGAAENFRYYASAIATIAGRSTPVGGSLLFYSQKEPVGVAAQIVPWNYPLLMATWKLAPALAAGCAVVLKPDPQTPLSVLRLAELAGEVGFPAGVINIVPGDGPTTGAYLVKHPGVDKVAFTGSTRTGGEIMRLCSDPIKRVTLELGGKSPNLLFADANLADAIPASVWAIFASAGQSCEARSRLLVEQTMYDDVVAQVTELSQRLKVGDPLDAETQMGSLISASHREKVHGFVEGAREQRVPRSRRAGRSPTGRARSIHRP